MEVSDLQHLENFIYDNNHLEEIEQSSDKFNVFNALRIVNQEIRHSNFLGWLLDPSETHELGDWMLSKFIKTIHYTSSIESQFSMFDLDRLKFDDVEVRREWRNIDILILDQTNKYYWLIENKVRSGEHSNQLSRYRDIVEAEFPDYNCTYIYLTVNGESSSDDNFIPVSYSVISSLVEKLLDAKSDKISSEISTFISHYNQMIKLHFMEDSKIQEICRDIYKSHKRALDLIFEHKPDELLDIKDLLISLIEKDDRLILEDSNKAYIRFIPKEMMSFVPMSAHNWIKSNRLLAFEFRNYDYNLSLHLIVGPGNESHRRTIYTFVQENKNLYSQARNKLAKQYYSIWKREFVKGDKRKSLDFTDLKELITSKFNKAIDKDIPIITENLSILEQHGFY